MTHPILRDEDLEKLMRLREAGTADYAVRFDPRDMAWVVYCAADDMTIACFADDEQGHRDADVVAAAVNALPALVKEVRELRTAMVVADAIVGAVRETERREGRDVDEMIKEMAGQPTMAEEIANLRAQLAATERARDEAMEALERYGEHDGDCAASVIGCAGDTACTCGYDAARSPSPDAKQGERT